MLCICLHNKLVKKGLLRNAETVGETVWCCEYDIRSEDYYRLYHCWLLKVNSFKLLITPFLPSQNKKGK